MKNLIAIFAVFVLAASFSFATDTFTSSKSGAFKTTVVCTPSLSDVYYLGDLGANSFTWGNKFKSFKGDPGDFSANWDLTGHPGTAYEITGSPATAEYITVSGAKLKGTWTGLAGLYEGAPLDCTNAHIISFQVDELDCTGTTELDQILTFTVTVNVTVSI